MRGVLLRLVPTDSQRSRYDPLRRRVTPLRRRMFDDMPLCTKGGGTLSRAGHRPHHTLMNVLVNVMRWV